MSTSLRFAILVAAALLATTGRPFWSSAVGLAAAAFLALAFAPAEIRRRGLPVATVLAAAAVVSVAPLLAP